MLFNRKKSEYDLFLEWANNATLEELENEYDKMRLQWIKNGCGPKPTRMEYLNRIIGEKGAKQWREDHPDAFTPGYRWTDKNRWE